MNHIQLIAIITLLMFTGCSKESKDQMCEIDQFTIKILEENDERIITSYKSGTDTIVSRWPIHYEIYHSTCGDIDGDGIAEILVGEIKTTRFDPVMRRRLNVFKLVDGRIREKWNGSRLGQPLVLFTIIETDSFNYLRTIEMERDSTYLVADYRWKGFGPDFQRYLVRNTTYGKAYDLF